MCRIKICKRCVCEAVLKRNGGSFSHSFTWHRNHECRNAQRSASLPNSRHKQSMEVTMICTAKYGMTSYMVRPVYTTYVVMNMPHAQSTGSAEDFALKARIRRHVPVADPGLQLIGSNADSIAGGTAVVATALVCGALVTSGGRPGVCVGKGGGGIGVLRAWDVVRGAGLLHAGNRGLVFQPRRLRRNA